jgi:phospholipid/cholesterol/gamma-HCH transport system ATP-binding protein
MRADPIEIEAKGLGKSFGGHAVLADVNLAVARGELVAIVGGSGSGKTVLMHLLAGLIEPSVGRVFAADHSREGSPLTDLSMLDGDGLDVLRRHWSMVFQKNALFSGSVRENCSLILREHGQLTEEEIDARVRDGLRAVALDPEAVLDKDRDELSGGMAKRVAIARAVAIDPALIFFDEPTTGLDPIIGAQIHDLIWATHCRPRRVPGGSERRTTIIITHDRELLRRLAPRVIMLENTGGAGRVCEDVPYEQFGTRGGPAADYLRKMPVLHGRDAD